MTGQGFGLEAPQRPQLGLILSFPQPGGTAWLRLNARPSVFWDFSLGQQGQVRQPLPPDSLKLGPGHSWAFLQRGSACSPWPGWGVGVCCGEEVSEQLVCVGGGGRGLVQGFCSVKPLWLLASLFWLCLEEGISPEPKQ